MGYRLGFGRTRLRTKLEAGFAETAYVCGIESQFVKISKTILARLKIATWEMGAPKVYVQEVRLKR
jgi:hypothetical protein